MTGLQLSSLCVKIDFQDSTTKDFLTLLLFKDRVRGEDIFNKFKEYVLETDVPIHKLVAITTDGALVLLLRAAMILLSQTLSYHCIIHQQALVGKVVDFSHVMTLVVKSINSTRAKALHHHLFKLLMDELDAAFGDLILHADICWLRRGKVLQRFVDLLQDFSVNEE